jgi:hypothetical protein
MAATMRTLALLLAAAVVLAAATGADAQTRRKRQGGREKPAAEPTVSVDRRDRTIALPGSPFNGRAYWHSLAQCGGIYFKLTALYTDAAIRARVLKPDPAANAQLSKSADVASRTATAYFVGAERFLVADRGLAGPEAILTYDPTATAAGDRLKSIDAAVQATKPCAAVYEACRKTFAKACGETLAATQ